MLCWHCCQIFRSFEEFGSPVPSGWPPLWQLALPSIDVVRYEAFRGCFICHAVLRSYWGAPDCHRAWGITGYSTEPKPVDTTGQFNLSLLQHSPESSAAGVYEITSITEDCQHCKSRSSPKIDSCDLSLTAIQHAATIDHDDLQSRQTPRDLKLMRHWLRDCLDNHPLCKAKVRRVIDRDLKIRLMDLGHEDPHLWRLIEVGYHDIAKYPFTTLSHRWTTRKTLRLEKSTYESLIKYTPVQDLPQTYQDAVTITQALGIRYLWIDSLCIFQDDDFDIEQAACNMASVYSYGVCNISDLAANPAGILTLQNQACVGDSVVACKQETGANNCYRFLDSYVWTKDVDQSPLRARGWVAQEQFLSPRALLIGQCQVFWECLSQRRLESKPVSIANTELSLRQVGWQHQWQQELLRLLRYDYSPLRIEKESSLSLLWSEFVNNYTRRQLSKPGDKLLAIAGIASVLGAVFNDSYLAGLWKSSMPHCLVWKNVAIEAAESTPKSDFRAPSWSWASVDGVVALGTFNDADVECISVARYVDSSIQHWSENPFGRVQRGSLYIQGILWRIAKGPIELEIRRLYLTSQLLDWTLERCSVFLDGRNFVHVQDENVYALPVLVCKASGREFGPVPELEGHPWIYGILLRRVEQPPRVHGMRPDLHRPANKACYERIGSFNVQGLLNSLGGAVDFEYNNYGHIMPQINNCIWQALLEDIEIT